jgi:hypothetical protein
MKNIKIQIKNILKSGPAQYRKRKLSGSGFVMLFAVALSGIIFAITLGVINIALKEIQFGSSAKDAGNAFFAADTGAEYVLFRDKPVSIYPMGSTDEVITGLGSDGVSCAKVNINKVNIVQDGATFIQTTIISKGYNIGDDLCESSNPERIEREIKLSY